MMVLLKISFFNMLKHTCLIIFSINFLIQPPDLNEVFWLVYNILIPYCFCQKVSWRIMPEPYNTKSLFEGLRGQLCCDFAGGLQLSIKVLTQTAYPIYRVVIQRFLTVYVKFRRYVPELSMNCNGERIQRILELLKFFWVENRRNRFLLSDHHRFTGRKFSHCYHRL